MSKVMHATELNGRTVITHSGWSDESGYYATVVDLESIAKPIVYSSSYRQPKQEAKDWIVDSLAKVGVACPAGYLSKIDQGSDDVEYDSADGWIPRRKKGK